MLNSDFQKAYDQFYTDNDTQWRMMGAEAKARNILSVCSELVPHKVLEVGAGDGSILHFLNEANFGKSLYALEIANSGVEHIKARKLALLVEASSFDGYKIPYEDDFFDLVILSHVLEHVEHERLLLRELKRVSKNLVVEVPKDYRFDVDKRMKHFLDYGHINMYTPTLVRYLLKSEGYDVVKEQMSLTAPKVIEYNTFVNQKKPKRMLTVARIHFEYFIKRALGKWMGRKTEERFASAYTVLVKRTDKDIRIF